MSRYPTGRVRPAALALLVLAGCADPQSISSPPAAFPRQASVGDVFTVTNLDDAGPGSLRAAIAAATDGAVIDFDPSLAGQTIYLSSGSLLVDGGGSYTISGPAAGGITISGSSVSRVLTVLNSDLDVRNLTIADGYNPAGGGPGPGGGIGLYRGQLRVENTTVSGNHATGVGGGIHARGTLIVTNSTISGNRGTNGGGIALDSGTLVLTNSTVAHNSALTAAGVYSALNTSVILRNNALAGNVDNNCGLAHLPAIQGLNIADDNSCGAGPGMLVADPLLGPLAANGGPTKTHAILAGSPAIDAAISCNVSEDQRHVSRPQGAACDVGAYEFDAYVDVALVVDNSAYVNPKTGAAVLTGSLRCSQAVAVDLQFALAQTVKGRVPATTQAASASTLACTTAVQYWSAVVAPAAGSFAPGSATAKVQSANTSPWVTPVSVTQVVKLFWGKG